MKCEECEDRKATLQCPECGIKVCNWCHDELKCPECAPLLVKIKERKRTVAQQPRYVHFVNG